MKRKKFPVPNSYSFAYYTKLLCLSEISLFVHGTSAVRKEILQSQSTTKKTIFCPFGKKQVFQNAQPIFLFLHK